MGFSWRGDLFYFCGSKTTWENNLREKVTLRPEGGTHLDPHVNSFNLQQILS